MDQPVNQNNGSTKGFHRGKTYSCKECKFTTKPKSNLTTHTSLVETVGIPETKDDVINTSLLQGDFDKIANARSNILPTQQNIEITSANHSTGKEKLVETVGTKDNVIIIIAG